MDEPINPLILEGLEAKTSGLLSPKFLPGLIESELSKSPKTIVVVLTRFDETTFGDVKYETNLYVSPNSNGLSGSVL